MAAERAARRNADAGEAGRGARGTRRATDEQRDPARGARAGAEPHSAQKPRRINKGAHKRSSFAPTSALRAHAQPSRAAAQERAGRLRRPLLLRSGTCVRRGATLEALPRGGRPHHTAALAPRPCGRVLRCVCSGKSRGRFRQASRGGGTLQPPHHGERGGRGASGHGRPLVPRRVAPGVWLQDAAEHGLERRPGAFTAREGCDGSACPDAAPRTGPRRVRHGHHQAHRGRETTRPDRRVRLNARPGGSALIDTLAGIGADIARDSSAKIEWSVNMQNFDQILAGARLSPPRPCALKP